MPEMAPRDPPWHRNRLTVLLGAILILLITLLRLLLLHPSHDHAFHPHPPLNASKLALLIENRPSPVLAPLILHFISVVPPDWRFRFMGSHASLTLLTRSSSILPHVRSGKLELSRIPPNVSTAGQEMISRFLTSLWLYESLLQPAEWLLLFQTDSMLCANSRHSLDDFLGYDWVGAPWNPGGSWGGNGGLSLRRVSRIVDVLRNQRRAPFSEPEDVWLSERIAAHPRGKVANGSVSLLFAGEVNSGVPVQVRGGNASEYIRGVDDWRDGFYEPMGYHTGGSGAFLHSGIWGTPELRAHIWKYCPEIKMTLAMDAAQYVPGNCGARWT